MRPNNRSCGATRLRYLVLAVLLVVIAAPAAMAGRTTQISSASGVAYAKAQLAKYQGPVDVVPAGKPFDASKLAGKTVWEIPLIATVPAIETIHTDITRAFGVAHIKVQECDGQGTPTGWNTCIRQAIAAKPAAIVLQSITPQAVEASLKAARDAKIPVLLDASFDSTAPLYPLASGQSSYDYTLGAKLTADWVIADSKGKANVLVIDTSDLSLQKAVTVNGYEQEFAKYCPACKVTVGAVTSIADWGTRITPLVLSELQRNPSINYVVAEYDAQAQYAAPAIAQLGKNSSVKIATYNADLAQMQAMASGAQPIGVDVGSDQNSLAWAEVDQALRVMSGLPPVKKENTGTRVFTASNTKPLKLDTATYNAGTWYGSSSYEAAYRKLWHIS